MATIIAGTAMHAPAVRVAPAVYLCLGNAAPAATATVNAGAAWPALAPRTAAAAIPTNTIHPDPLVQDVNSAHFHRTLLVFPALHAPVAAAITNQTALGFQALLSGTNSLPPSQALKPPQKRTTTVKYKYGVWAD